MLSQQLHFVLQFLESIFYFTRRQKQNHVQLASLLTDYQMEVDGNWYFASS